MGYFQKKIIIGRKQKEQKIIKDIFQYPSVISANILTSAFNFRYGDDNNENRITYLDYLGDNSPENLREITRRFDDEYEKEPNLEYSLTYKRKFERKGHELSIDFRYQDEEEEEGSEFTEETFNPDGSPTTPAGARKQPTSARSHDRSHPPA